MTRAEAELAARAGVRLLALACLLVIGLVRWFGLLRDVPAGRAVWFAVFAAVVSAALVATARLPRRRTRLALAAAGTVALAAGALHAAGVALWMLDPRDWGTLGGGLGDGIGALPGVTVPYRGADDWVRVAIASGGTALAAIAALAAGWPRARGRSGSRPWALVALAVLFAVPAVQLTADAPWSAGALFAVPLCLFVLADRLPLRLGLAGAGVLAACVLLAMLVAPALDRGSPVIDVQQLASSLQPNAPDQFDWTHGYGPLDWPRDGRELLRVRARRASYWKADDLEVFDGVRWRQEAGFNPDVPVGAEARLHPAWRQRVLVTVKDLRTRQFVAPGETLSVSRSPRDPINTRPGGFAVAFGKPDLTGGDAYFAESYVPRPRAAELRRAPVAYPSYLREDLTMLTPPDGSNARTMISFMPFGSHALPVAYGPGVAGVGAVQVLERSGYGAVYRLARRLAARSATPYDYVRRVERYLAGPRFSYEEKAAVRRLPIPAFLLRDRAGYCQHFSGAMALLLRMGGVAARVSAGFSPGQLDAKRGEYVVRDVDAHSWVEAWFAGIGWVTFDPTPVEAPARSQVGGAVVDTSVVPGGPRPTGAVGGGADVGPADAPAALDGGGGGTPWPTIAAIMGGALLVALAWAAAVRRRARRRTGAGAPPAEVAELVRALRRTGRAVAPGTTLLALERRFAQSPGAREYVRTVAARRYGGGAARPTSAQRRALRRELAGGLGPIGRIRAFWALPPRLH